MPPQYGWTHNGGEGTVGDLHIRLLRRLCGRFAGLIHHAVTLCTHPRPRVEWGLVRRGDDELASVEEFVIGSHEGLVRVLRR